ncbi:MAG: ATP-binding cassette domain-containing protein [candidate division KSB1 bacterium]|nr:ATP-binding cassette domain-containing protein [candidate division KSB1 bacterium]
MKPIIQVKNLTTQFDHNVVLKDVSVDIYPHQITVILGRSGCGKTTFLKNLIRLIQPTAGSIEIMGQEVTAMEEVEFNRILRQIGVLFQNGALLNSLTVGENVAIPLEQHTNLPRGLIQRLVLTKLHLVELDHAIHLFPSQLSGGMRKRAALARAIALDPLILFGDEPTAGLDPITAAGLDQLLFKLRDLLNMTLVIVTHELASIQRIADRIIFLEQGQVLFQGTIQQALAANIPAIQHFFNPTSRH